MVRKLQTLTAGVIATLTLIAGVLVLPAGVLPASLGGTDTVKACEYSKFRVVWSYAGVYRHDGVLIDSRTAGQTVRSLPGHTAGGWTKFVIYDWDLGGYVMMRDGALQYIGCG